MREPAPTTVLRDARSHLDDAKAFVTLDGATIRELAGRVSLPADHLYAGAQQHSNDDTVLTGG
jgi:hypothetical protein